MNMKPPSRLRCPLAGQRWNEDREPVCPQAQPAKDQALAENGRAAADRERQPAKSGSTTGTGSYSGGEPLQRHPASGDQPAGENQVSRRAGRSERGRDDEKPPSGAGNRGCGVVRVQAAVDL